MLLIAPLTPFWTQSNPHSHELSALENGFASLSKFLLHGTFAAGDGIVFKMIMPTNEEGGGDSTSCFTRKGYYAYDLQVQY
jgi:hypothetical protein